MHHCVNKNCVFGQKHASFVFTLACRGKNMIVEANQENFECEVFDARNITVLLDFTADWCWTLSETNPPVTGIFSAQGRESRTGPGGAMSQYRDGLWPWCGSDVVCSKRRQNSSAFGWLSGIRRRWNALIDAWYSKDTAPTVSDQTRHGRRVQQACCTGGMLLSLTYKPWFTVDRIAVAL